MKNYYEILGVQKDADLKEIKSAYRKLVKLFHPDATQKSGKKVNAKIFQEISAAYSVLNKPEKRKEYNLTLADKKNGNPAYRFDFREFKNWLYSLSIIKMLLISKRVTVRPREIDPIIMGLSIDELLKRIIYSRNIYVKIAAVQALLAQKKHYAVNDLLRLLYSNIDETVKIEIIKGLKDFPESKIKKVIREIYDVEKSLRVRQSIRSIMKI